MRTLTAILGCLLLSGALGFSHFYQRYQQQKQRLAQTEKQLALRQAVIDDMRARQRDIAALDTRYTRELSDAQHTIEKLQRDVAGGAKQLRLAAACEPLPASTSAARVDDAARPRLTDAAERDYFRLRSRTALVLKQLAGLQDYVRQQCLKPINKGENK
ncbi:lysis protein [Dryocola sp. BD613]|uniref:lysis protein n=1 Tax=Dryocola sp. BD613 TaxID=3133272 RepID=UPI003F4F8934